jgi:hypothetical protein
MWPCEGFRAPYLKDFRKGALLCFTRNERRHLSVPYVYYVTVVNTSHAPDHSIVNPVIFSMLITTLR